MFRNRKGFTNAVLGIMSALTVSLSSIALAYEIELDNGSYSWNRWSDRPSQSLPSDVGKAAFDKAMDPAHVVFEHVGLDMTGTLTVDQDGPERLFELLGRVDALADAYPTVPLFGYVSSRQGDATVLLARVEKSPKGCGRLFQIELRRDAKGLPLAGKLHPSLGLSSAVATKSGLRLGLTKGEVKAVLGWPHHEEPDSLRYGATCKVFLSREEVLARGYPEKYVRKGQLIYRTIIITFTDGLADSIFVKHRITWD